MTTTLSFERWHKLSQDLGIAADQITFDRLQSAYTESHRIYHTTSHLLACLTTLDRHAHQAEHLAELELALWFHDAIYDPKSSKNEAQSAIWASCYLQQQGASVLVNQRIRRMILATAEHGLTTQPDTQLLLDIDLAILGQDADTFDRYNAAIRQEYAWVSDVIYRQQRQSLLQSFLARESIYQTTTFRDCYEQTARQNLSRALDDLKIR